MFRTINLGIGNRSTYQLKLNYVNLIIQFLPLWSILLIIFHFQNNQFYLEHKKPIFDSKLSSKFEYLKINKFVKVVDLSL